MTTTNITFWNGNKSAVRQQHELELTQAILAASKSDYGDSQLIVDETDYPRAEDEGDIFNKGADLLVTVAGNAKFDGKAFIPLYIPLAQGILGNRIMIIRREMQDTFSNLSTDELKQLRAGIPATWADAELFRSNGYQVVERGLFEEIFLRLEQGECDYVALGANEVLSIYQQMTQPEQALSIERDLLLHYPFYLVYYLHPQKPELAERIRAGLEAIQHNGVYASLFDKYYGHCRTELNLTGRRRFNLDNPVLPEGFTN